MRIRVSFSLHLPEGTSPEDIERWLRFELGVEDKMNADNKLAMKWLGHSGVRDLEWEER